MQPAAMPPAVHTMIPPGVRSLLLATGVLLASGFLPVRGQQQTMSFEEYEPVSMLVVPAHPVTRAKYPFIDVHNHQAEMPTQDLRLLVAEMDKLNMAVMVNLSGRGFKRLVNPDSSVSLGIHGGEYLKAAVDNANRTAPGRFLVFTNVDFTGIGRPGWSERAVRELEQDVRHGAAGLKIYKDLGLDLTDSSGQRVPVDDPRLDPIWEKCAELKIPVLIHSGDPAAFWLPHDRFNERWLELKQFPGRHRHGREPSWEQVMTEHFNLMRRHPRTTFISAHMGWLASDLTRLGRLLDEIPNLYTELGAIIYDPGRQPRFAREWFIKYQDRVLFGKDIWAPREYHVYFRVLETADEYFDYYRKRHAFWKLYGLDLPDDVLKKIYYKNALRLLPGIDATRFPE
ncbi:MAG: amidohydrolase [candidate division KSB1 bacterium]|nr:amidohydrolase [candidate division KSB1 bacterium]MDZ7276128.1 amidohydrolase [candidate division KSB1 bacterium]MDZ7287092.1 amidohydrolase [candidate division KSB1 bacterium]MDZ7296983.1 amidohydrolase [candidate division KSB1 bacterium]MDZ7306187.1 amidohydrolase [candidate division KSB1 bacterium]